MADTPTDFRVEWATDREELAAVFRRFAAALERDDPVRIRGDDASATLVVPPRVAAELELERDADEDPAVAELSLEPSWEAPHGSCVRSDGEGRAGVETVIAPRAGLGRGERPSEAASATMPPEAVVPNRNRETATGSDASADADAGASGEADGEARTSRFEVYEDRAGEWRWRLRHWNGNIIADGGEGYASKSNAKRAVRSVMRSAPTARIEDRD